MEWKVAVVVALVVGAGMTWLLMRQWPGLPAVAVSSATAAAAAAAVVVVLRHRQQRG